MPQTLEAENSDALTALSLASPIQILMSALGLGIAVGLNAVISKALGKRMEEGWRKPLRRRWHKNIYGKLYGFGGFPLLCQRQIEPEFLVSLTPGRS